MMYSFHNDMKNIKSNLENSYPPFLIDRVIRKYPNDKFSSKQNQLKTHLTFIALNYDILATVHIILKINIPNFLKRIL